MFDQLAVYSSAGEIAAKGSVSSNIKEVANFRFMVIANGWENDKMLIVLGWGVCANVAISSRVISVYEVAAMPKEALVTRSVTAPNHIGAIRFEPTSVVSSTCESKLSCNRR